MAALLALCFASTDDTEITKQNEHKKLTECVNYNSMMFVSLDRLCNVPMALCPDSHELKTHC